MFKDYVLKCNSSSFEALDNFALLAVQQYNLGDRDDWFDNFRGWFYGFYARITNVQTHFRINMHLIFIICALVRGFHT